MIVVSKISVKLILKKENYFKKQLCKLPIHQKINRFDLGDLVWEFDTVSLHPSATWDEKLIYPKTEPVYVFTEVMNKELVEKFSSQTFTNGSAILKVKFRKPKK